MGQIIERENKRACRISFVGHANFLSARVARACEGNEKNQGSINLPMLAGHLPATNSFPTRSRDFAEIF